MGIIAGTGYIPQGGGVPEGTGLNRMPRLFRDGLFPINKKTLHKGGCFLLGRVARVHRFQSQRKRELKPLLRVPVTL